MNAAKSILEEGRLLRARGELEFRQLRSIGIWRSSGKKKRLNSRIGFGKINGPRYKSSIKRKRSSNHGGRRRGAGRKPTGKRRQFIAVGLPPYLYSYVTEKALRLEWRPAKLAEQMIEFAFEKGFVPTEG